MHRSKDNMHRPKYNLYKDNIGRCLKTAYIDAQRQPIQMPKGSQYKKKQIQPIYRGPKTSYTNAQGQPLQMPKDSLHRCPKAA